MPWYGKKNGHKAAGPYADLESRLERTLEARHDNSLRTTKARNISMNRYQIGNPSQGLGGHVDDLAALVKRAREADYYETALEKRNEDYERLKK
ncbi:hypothetical protein A4X09_0g7496 [Tilletia walkeri]|uniref:Uncharacterized protein n=1 Tax=Tilletia walkeri TaxID=117179 RepID=A0A8X7T1E4_9BASI|nr:hypothetical protein A4X09_0g7496 [Tilletia walkeri]